MLRVLKKACLSTDNEDRYLQMTIAPQFLEQMQQCLRNVNTALEAVGGSLNDVVSLRIYMVNYDPDTEGDIIAEGLKEFFPGEYPPATTWIGVSSLAVKDFLIEIEVTAVLE